MNNQITSLKNRIEAGQLLAKKLINYRNANDTIVLGLPRGGIPVAYEIAIELNLPLDALIVRKIALPPHEEYALGAITINNISFLNSFSFNNEALKEKLDLAIQEEQKELARRNNLYRNGRPMPKLKDKCILLVDDGVATGASMKVAIMALKSFEVRQIIVATPIIPSDTLYELVNLVEEVVYLYAPSPFFSVGMWYHEFPQTTDEEVIKLMHKFNY